MALQKTFSDRVCEVVRRIPAGSVLTYQEVAKRAGSPWAYRAVGNILNRNHNLSIPCHRVVRSDGRVGGFNRGIDEKKKLLRREGVVELKG